MIRRASAPWAWSTVALVAAVAGCAASPREPTRSAVAAATRYRVGDRVVYRYGGATLHAPVMLTERIVAQTGNRLEIEVTAVRGEETRQWVQLVTDTPENQRNDVIDELYEVVDGQRRRLSNEGNRDVMRMYEWTLPAMEGALRFERNDAVTIDFGGQRHTCTRETNRATIAGRPARFIRHTCPSFLWTNGPALFRDDENGEVLWQVEVVEARGP
jgi:hypothetical protein